MKVKVQVQERSEALRPFDLATCAGPSRTGVFTFRLRETAIVFIFRFSSALFGL